MIRRITLRRSAAGLVLVATLGLPLVLTTSPSGQYILNILIYALVYAFLSTAWNILGGFGGLHSIGNAIFLGIGAYSSTLLFVKTGLSPWLGMLVGAGLASVVGLAIAGTSLRWGLRGAYFALVTLALAEGVRALVTNIPAFGGSSGVEVPLAGNGWLAVVNFRFTDNLPYYYLALALAIGVVGLVGWLRRKPIGYALLASRENEAAAESLGVNVWRVRVAAATLMAGLTALGGTFLAQYVGYIHPNSFFGEIPSVQILIFAIAGGIGTTWGPLVGAMLLVPVAEATRSVFAGSISGAPLLFYGTVLVLAMMFMPQGVLGLARSVRWPSARKRRPSGGQ